MPPERLIAAMNLQPNSVVADVGAGYGFFSLPLAASMSGAGTLLATDVDPDAVLWLAAKAQEQQTTRLIPQHVRSQGLDPIYRERRYDAILMCDSWQMIGGSPEASREFYRGLRSTMNDDGRLWIVGMRLDSDFCVEEFDDTRTITAALAASSLGELLKRQLRLGTILALDDPAVPPEKSLPLLVADLNRLLNDPTFFPAAEAVAPGGVAGGGEKLLDERRRALREQLWKLAGEAPIDSGAAVGPAPLRLLNRLVIHNTLKSQVWERAFGLDRLWDELWLHLLNGLSQQAQVIGLFESSGFTLAKEHRFYGCCNVWEFHAIPLDQLTEATTASATAPASSLGPSPRAQPTAGDFAEFQAYQAKVYSQFDRNRDSRLDEAEVVALRTAIEQGELANPPLPPLRPGPLPPELKKYDASDNGKLDGPELLALQLDALTGKLRPPGGGPPGAGPPGSGPPGGGGPGIPNGIGPPQEGGTRMLPGHSAPAQLSQERKAIMRREKVIEVLRLKPGASVVDIGAGHGLFTFPLAEVVGKQGTVFATDVDPGVIRSLTRRAALTGASNVKPVRVIPFGVDSFYTKERFDVVFMCDSVQLIQDPVNFFQQLKGSFKPEGRLWILALRLDADFSPEEFQNLEVIRSVVGDSSLTAVTSHLSPETKSALEKGAAEESFRLLARDASRMLNDPALYQTIVSAWGEASPRWNSREQELRRYLAAEVADWVPAKDGQPSAAPARLRLLNRLVLQDVFKTGVWEKAFSLDQYQLDEWQFLIRGMDFDTQFVPLLRDSGYELVAEHPVLDAYRTWELRPTP